MAAYLMPRETRNALSEPLKRVEAKTTVVETLASDLVFAVIFTSEEKTEFGNNGDAPLALSTQDAAEFESVIPEFSGKTRNYVRVTSKRARRAFDAFFDAEADGSDS
ncbi:hypothetical protein GCM10007385_23010 [Tateyamaria omphalii]|uniref:hypothetical protein n=1 Tax=Tateyamaria omphalii TaxID=299262 RepID=UPI0016735CF4|nr:hypothetical protein [Tateyamaria omphalii]GGX54205.1 hypothetical protein GCM10007385_23010 [Tateyamaria omphalii]